jgi:cobalt transporter subunit CbtB
MQVQAATPAVASIARGARLWSIWAVLGFGLLMLFGVGFSTLSVAHNAAHDTRHATGFPCH